MLYVLERDSFNVCFLVTKCKYVVLWISKTEAEKIDFWTELSVIIMQMTFQFE